MDEYKTLSELLNKEGVNLSHLLRIIRKLSEKYPVLYEIHPESILRNELVLPEEVNRVLFRMLEIYAKYILALPISIMNKPTEDEVLEVFDLFEEEIQIKSIIRLVLKKAKDNENIMKKLVLYLRDNSILFRKIEIEDVKITADADECLTLLSTIVNLVLRIYIESYGRENGLREFMKEVGVELVPLRKVLIKLKVANEILGGVFEKICIPRIKNIDKLIGAGHFSMGEKILIKYHADEVKDRKKYEFVMAISEDILMRSGVVLSINSIGSNIIHYLPETIIIKKIYEVLDYDYNPTKLVVIEDLSEVFADLTVDNIKNFINKLKEREFLVVFLADVERDIYLLPLLESIVNYVIEVRCREDTIQVIGEKGTSRESFILKSEKGYRTLQKIRLKKEETLDEKYRKILVRNYGVIENTNEKILAIRLPCENIEKVSDNHLHEIDKIIREKEINIINFRSVYIIFDEEFLELDGKTLAEIISSKSSSRLKRYAEKSILGERDRVLREILDEMTFEGARYIIKSRRGGRYGLIESSFGRGKVVGYRPASEEDLKNPSSIAIIPSIRIAAIKRGGEPSPSNLLVNVRPSDLQVKIRKTRTRTLIGLVVDISQYENIEIRKKIIISIATSLLKDAYERRDQVALVVFNNTKARLLVDFTGDVEYVGKVLREVEFGGLTPLASGILTGYRVLQEKIGDRLSVIPILIVFSTGVANVPLYPGGDIRRELINICKIIKQSSVLPLFIDISRDGALLVKDLASMSGGRYYHPAALSYFYRYLRSTTK